MLRPERFKLVETTFFKLYELACVCCIFPANLENQPMSISFLVLMNSYLPKGMVTLLENMTTCSVFDHMLMCTEEDQSNDKSWSEPIVVDYRLTRTTNRLQPYVEPSFFFERGGRGASQALVFFLRFSVYRKLTLQPRSCPGNDQTDLKLDGYVQLVLFFSGTCNVTLSSQKRPCQPVIVWRRRYYLLIDHKMREETWLFK